MKRINAAAGNIYTIMVGQQPIGMARADNPQDAIAFVRQLCDEALDVTELRLRKPTAEEAEIFQRHFGSVKKDGILGFVF